MEFTFGAWRHPGRALRLLLALLVAISWAGCTTPQHGAKRVSGRITRLQGYGGGAAAGAAAGAIAALLINGGKIDQNAIAPIVIGAVVGAAAGGALAEREISKRQTAANLDKLVDARLEDARKAHSEAEALLNDVTGVVEQNQARLAASPSPDELKALQKKAAADFKDAEGELKKLEEHLAYQKKLRDEAKERGIEKAAALDEEVAKLEGTTKELAQKVDKLREQSVAVI